MTHIDKNNVDKATEKYLHSIILGKTQHNRALSAIDNLKSIFKNQDSGSDIPSNINMYIQGSFATRTTIQPRIEVDDSLEYDVDFVVESKDWDKDNPRSALVAIQNRLKQSKFANESITVKASCVRVQYADGPIGEKFHVDVVPILLNEDIRYVAVNRKNDSDWVYSDPVKLINWFNNKVKEEPTFRPHYLIIKRLVLINGVDIPSIALQRLVSDSYKFKAGSGKYLRELLEIARGIVSNLDNPDYRLTNPVNDAEDLAERVGTTELKKLKDMLLEVESRIISFAQNGSSDILANIFGYYFPSSLDSDHELSLRANQKYFDCDYADRIGLSVDCENGKIEGHKYELTVDSNFVNDKDNQRTLDKLVFNVGNDFIDHDVLWQVSNDPDEVPFQKRGDFYDDNTTREETVSWAGRHYVRAYILDGDRCKHISNKFQVNVLRDSTTV